MKEIRKEVVIAAPPAEVWVHVTDPSKIAGWLMPNDFEARVGRMFTLDCNEQGPIACEVKEVEPERKLVYSFRSRATKVDTVVTITLTPEGQHTRVTLVHTGWDALPPEDQGVAGAFEDGWGLKLNLLRDQVVGNLSTAR